MEKHISNGEEKQSSQLPGKKKRFTILQILLTIYGLLYLLLIVSSFFAIENYDIFDLELIVVNLALILFLVGYYIVWKNEKIAGIIFLFHWVIMWVITLFIAQTDRGMSVVLGFPLFILGILFIISWYRKKSKEKIA